MIDNLPSGVFLFSVRVSFFAAGVDGFDCNEVWTLGPHFLLAKLSECCFFVLIGRADEHRPIDEGRGLGSYNAGDVIPFSALPQRKCLQTKENSPPLSPTCHNVWGILTLESRPCNYPWREILSSLLKLRWFSSGTGAKCCFCLISGLTWLIFGSPFRGRRHSRAKTSSLWLLSVILRQTFQLPTKTHSHVEIRHCEIPLLAPIKPHKSPEIVRHGTKVVQWWNKTKTLWLTTTSVRKKNFL